MQAFCEKGVFSITMSGDILTFSHSFECILRCSPYKWFLFVPFSCSLKFHPNLAKWRLRFLLAKD